jgi:hypothetical protein
MTLNLNSWRKIDPDFPLFIFQLYFYYTSDMGDTPLASLSLTHVHYVSHQISTALWKLMFSEPQ